MLLDATSDAQYDGDIVRKLPSIEMASCCPPKVFKRKSASLNKPDIQSKISLDPRSTAESCLTSVMSVSRPDMADDEWSKTFLQIQLNDL